MVYSFLVLVLCSHLFVSIQFFQLSSMQECVQSPDTHSDDLQACCKGWSGFLSKILVQRLVLGLSSSFTSAFFIISAFLSTSSCFFGLRSLFRTLVIHGAALSCSAACPQMSFQNDLVSSLSGISSSFHVLDCISS